MKLPSDFGNEIVKALGLPMKVIEDLFEFEEDKEGFFYAKLKLKKFLEKPEFKKMCTLVRELGGENYLEGMKAWKVPGPFAKIASTRSSEGSSGVTPHIVSEDKTKTPEFGSLPEKVVPARRETRNMNVFDTLISELAMGVYSPRKSFSPNYIQELAESIELDGQLKPITVQLKEGQYPVIDGEHRIRAMQVLDRKMIRAEVVKCSDEEALFMAMQTNELHGKRLEPLEEAFHIKRMLDEQKLSEQQIATKFKRTQAWISQRLSLIYSLSPTVQDNVINRFITSTHALELSKLPKEKQDKVAEFVSKEKPSVKETKFLIHLVKEQPSKAEELLEKDKKYLKAEMKHEEVIETKERFDELIKAAKEPWQDEHTCIQCGSKFKVSWKEGTIEWMSEPSASTI